MISNLKVVIGLLILSLALPKIFVSCWWVMNPCLLTTWLNCLSNTLNDGSWTLLSQALDFIAWTTLLILLVDHEPLSLKHLTSLLEQHSYNGEEYHNIFINLFRHPNFNFLGNGLKLMLCFFFLYGNMWQSVSVVLKETQ